MSPHLDPSSFDHSIFPSPASQPQHLQDVLDFWFPLPDDNDGVHHSAEALGSSPSSSANKKKTRYLNDPSYVQGHIAGWMLGGEIMDEKCRQFRSLVRMAAENEASPDNRMEIENNNGGIDERATLISKIILFDQITRNAFRCEEEAYSYDGLVLDILYEIFLVEPTHRLDEHLPEQNLKQFVNADDVTFAECLFVSIACQHREEPIFHDVCNRLNDLMELRWPAAQDFLKLARVQAQSHFDALKRFGRYPHRNHTQGREDTGEERAWLDDYDNLPGWAKSQLPTKG